MAKKTNLHTLLISLAFSAGVFVAPLFAQPVDLLPDIIIDSVWLNEHDVRLSDTLPGQVLFRLSNGTANKGSGPLHLMGQAPLPNGTQPVHQRIFRSDGSFYDRVAGTFIFHPSHDHVHFEDWCIYSLREVLPGDGVGDILRQSGKVSFCIIDLMDFNPALPGHPPLPVYDRCDSTVQGLSVGWLDVYDLSLPDQDINVTGLTDGEYWLESVADPLDHVLESDEANNVARLKVYIDIPHCNDIDVDGYGDPADPENVCADDNCPATFNPSQLDTDADGLGDACDPDMDNDAVPNGVDNCPLASNPAQENSDSDLYGDLCDNCPIVTNADQRDQDEDSTGDVCDVEVLVYSQILPNGILDEPYYFEFQGVGGTPPHNWTLLGGDIPFGCNFTGGLEGIIQGVPNFATTYYFTVELRDDAVPHHADTESVAITIVEAALCGDVDDNGLINISDAVYLINYIFAGGPPPPSSEIADVNEDLLVSISDAVYLINFIFSFGPPPCVG